MVLAQFLYIMIPEFFGTAARAGPSHVALWILAIAVFFIPEALVVAHLNRLMPLEGGAFTNGRGWHSATESDFWLPGICGCMR